MIPTLGRGALYHIHRNRERWLTELERRRAYSYCLGIFTVIVIGALIWILR